MNTKKELTIKNVIIPNSAIVAVSKNGYLLDIDGDEKVWVSKNFVHLIDSNKISTLLSVGIVMEFEYNAIDTITDEFTYKGETLYKTLLDEYKDFNYNPPKEDNKKRK